MEWYILIIVDISLLTGLLGSGNIVEYPLRPASLLSLWILLHSLNLLNNYDTSIKSLYSHWSAHKAMQMPRDLKQLSKCLNTNILTNSYEFVKECMRQCISKRNIPFEQEYKLPMLVA